MPNPRLSKSISLNDFIPKDSKRKDERHSREKNCSKRRYNLRGKEFWNINWEDSDEEQPKPRWSPKVKNWADCVDELDQENDIVMKSPEKKKEHSNRRFRKDVEAKKSFENDFKWTNSHKTHDEEFPELTNRKRERNADDSPRKFSVSNHPEFVKRRLRSGSDGVSTTSSSMNSSDNEQEGTKLGKRYETDPTVLSRRQKQIDYGKNTKAYRKYLEEVPIEKRTAEDIFTPKKHIMYSRRSWDNQIKIWRRQLHQYDPESDNEEEGCVDLSDMISMMASK